MKTLRIDIETHSSIDLIKSGVYRYVEASDFEILLFGYAFDDEPVKVIDLASYEDLPEEVYKALTDSKIIKTAYNANFERTCISKHFNLEMNPSQWRCTAVHAAYLGLPGGLDNVAKVLELDVQKDTAGKNLIKYFSIPCKPTIKNGGRLRNYPEHNLEKWEKFKAYCIRDVEVEREMASILSYFPVPEQEQKLWELDQRINDGGICVDENLVVNAIECDGITKEKLMQELKDLTKLDNPNSGAQLKGWISENEGIEVDSLTKAAVSELLDSVENMEVKKVLKLKQLISKTSVKKYEAIQRMLCEDKHVRGILQFYGANRSGRWAGRGLQAQNLPRNYLPDLELARNLVKSADYETLDMLFGNVPDTLSQLIRTALLPEEGEEFCVADFSAIEARVIAWLAKEKWRLDVFNTHGKIYEASASQMFNVPLELISKGNPEYELRQKGKVAELALGYGGSVGALMSMGALNMGLTEDELPDLVKLWRKANPKITKLWWNFGDAVVQTVNTGKSSRVGLFIIRIESGKGLRFLTIELPSGRKLYYFKPETYVNKFNRDSVRYWDIEPTTKKWGQVSSYGPQWVQNVTQAIARDCLAITLLRLAEAGYSTKFHVHDECIVSAKNGEAHLSNILDIMSEPIDWAPGLPLTADGYVTKFYMKD